MALSGRGRPSRVVLASAAAVALVTVAVGAAIGFGGRGAEHTPAATDLPPATVAVAKGTLTQTEKVNGTLSYGAPKGLITAAKGILTWVASPGSVVKLGQPVYKVDDRPVVLIHGTVPPYRTLHPGVRGADVKEFEQSLKKLGHTGFTVDDKYTWETAVAVAAWQEEAGLPQTGTVSPGQIAVAAGDIRVSLLGVQPGALLGTEANQTVLTYSGTTRVVTIALDVAKQQLVKKGIAATVLLPTGGTVAGTVQSVGAVATQPEATDGGQAQPATIEVVVTIADQDKLGTLDAAPVGVQMASQTHENVLIVPITALIALSEGGYGVQVIEAGTAQYVPVKTGLFANGKVEISGPGIAEAVTVGVPAS